MSELKEQRKVTKEPIMNENQIKLKGVEPKQIESETKIDLKTPRLKTSLSQSICE